jgi:hypothetical protein
VARVLQQLGQTWGVQQVRALLEAQYADIAGALKSVFNLSANEMASVLKSALGWGEDATRTVMNGLGYAASEVESALSSAFDWFKDKFNPSNW